MQKHARASKIAHIFQTRDERRVRREGGKGRANGVFPFSGLTSIKLSLSGALEEHSNARGTDPALTLITMIGRFN